MSICQPTLFGNTSQYIKTNAGDLVATNGSNTMERLILSDLRIPYKQILKSRVILKAGQINYLLNHLGLGSDCTFLAIKVTFDTKSAIADDNYICWSYYNDLSRINYCAQFMVLTGNTTHRIPQLYLTNPNSKYSVSLDVMVAVVDDTYTIFTDVVNQTGTSFTGLEYTDIHTYVIGESIVINDKSVPARPLIYITLSEISSIQKNGTILIIDDNSHGSIFLDFLTEYDCYQAQSLINYVLENPNVIIDDLNPVADLVDPILYFYSQVGNTGDFISFNGATSGVPYNTSYGYTFSTSIQFGTYSVIDKPNLINLLIDTIHDNRDGTMSIMPSNLIITGTAGTLDNILNVGTYSLTFNFSDIAQNYLDGIIVDLDITL